MGSEGYEFKGRGSKLYFYHHTSFYEHFALKNRPLPHPHKPGMAFGNYVAKPALFLSTPRAFISQHIPVRLGSKGACETPKKPLSNGYYAIF